MESAHTNTLCISKQEVLSASPQRSKLLLLMIWDRSEQAWRCGAGVGMGIGRRFFCSSLQLSSPIVIFKGDLIDAFVRLGQSKQTDEDQQEDEKVRRRARSCYYGGQTETKGTKPFCAMIQSHLIPADREELSQVILNQWNKQKIAGRSLLAIAILN